MNTNKCSGCKLCEKICPKQAIKFKEKWFGFSYPEINNDVCIHCGLCDKVCPTNNIETANIKECFIGYNDTDIRLKCSSGGIFPEIANYVLSQNGIVFGAVFDKEWNVVITYTDNDITPMLGSKYVQSDVKNTYKECKDFLDQGRMVLYSGTPCQIYGLKGFLKKDYDNLITLDIFCHGVPSPKAWQNYIKSFNKEIESINFRDKRNSWSKYNLTIKFKDGTEFSEYHRDNKYMKLFLDDKILRKSCFSCQLRKSSKSDITIGDAWHIQSKLKNDLGLSNIIIHTNKGYNLFNKLNLVKEKIDYNKIYITSCLSKEWKIPEEREVIRKQLDNKKIAIITNQMNTNVGGILQAFALSEKVKELTDVKPVFIHQRKNHLSFLDEHCNWTEEGFTDDYTTLIVGSDQIWNHRAPSTKKIPFEDKYLIHDNNIQKIVYAASFSHHELLYNTEELNQIKESLKNVNFVSCREIRSIDLIKEWFDKECVAVLDPTLLYEKEFYLDTIKESNSNENKGIFVYVLDKNNEWDKLINKISKELNEPILPFDGSVNSFIKNYNNSKFVLTDSYHGSVFSLIFNKPFITLRNTRRGNDRFDDLCLRFNIENRFIDNLNNIDLSLLTTNPECLEKIRDYRKYSLNYLYKALFSF